MMKYAAAAVALTGGFAGCDDEFLDRVPQTSVTVPAFFKSTSDLELYVNNLYHSMMPGGVYDDRTSDNVTFWQDSEPYVNKLFGRLSSDVVGGWSDWGNLRSVNLMLTNLDDVSGSEADVNHYAGIAHYFRARFYIEKVKAYSDVPWYGEVIESNDEESLYKTQDPRAAVVDNIMADLEFAAAHIKADMGNRTRIHKYAALAELSRFALYEGTYRKYHSELGLASTANRFLERAVSASEEIMNSGQFEITGTGAVVTLGESGNIYGSTGFRSLFSSSKLDGNSEIILWAEYGRSPYFRNNLADVLTAMSRNFYSLSRSLQESFLTREGKPYSTVAGYATKEYADVFIDRDPRMAETFVWPGLHETNNDGSTIVHIGSPGRGGYRQSKFFCESTDLNLKTNDVTGQFTSLPLYRYGEVLLNYAEALAELGRLGAGEIERSVNLLRNRVGMPPFNAAAEVDDALKALYPDVSDNTILAVRRERRVELAGEGLRQSDIYRWGAGKLFEADVSKQGIYVPGLPYVIDVTGDGTPDYGIAANADSRTSEVEQWYDLDGSEIYFYLENGTSGYIRNKNDEARSFEEPKYYYDPIPKVQITLNPSLNQPFGWQ
jgi:hypothetical protein